MTSPLVHELTTVPDPLDALRAVASWPGVVLLESARRDGPRSRFSFLTAAPVWTTRLQKARYGEDPFLGVREQLASIAAATVKGLPPFQGGAVGLASYELGGCWERLPAAPHDEFEMPALVVGIHDWVLAWDHAENAAWIIAQDVAEESPSVRIERVLDALRSQGSNSARSPSTARRIAVRTPRHRLRGEWTSNFTRGDYLDAVERVVEYIRAGDVFQTNLSQRLVAPANESSVGGLRTIEGPESGSICRVLRPRRLGRPERVAGAVPSIGRERGEHPTDQRDASATDDSRG